MNTYLQNLLERKELLYTLIKECKSVSERTRYENEMDYINQQLDCLDGSL